MGGQIIKTTDFHFPGQKSVYHGKVRDVYDFGETLVQVATDRYSAFDRNLALVPYKGQLLTGITDWWFAKTKHIVGNHVISHPDANVLICKKYKVVPIEMVVRGYITGVTSTSLWHNYNQGQRDFGDFSLPDRLHKNDKLPESVLTPTTKFEKHDRNLTPKQAVKEGLVSADIWQQMQDIARRLFNFGQKRSASAGLILVDTKYEFGLDDKNELVLIDEIHTPDSSRFWLADSYKQQIDQGEEPDNYDKEFLRLWFKARFDPYKDKTPPKPPSKIINELSQRYAYVYERLTGQSFLPNTSPDPLARIESNVLKALRGVK